MTSRLLVALVMLTALAACGASMPSGPSAEPHGGRTPEGACRAITHACHAADHGSGLPHECHAQAHGTWTDAECEAHRADCEQACR